MNEQKPLVSIVIPCYNAEPWVGEALDSCLAQTYRPLEVIVIDDGSTDGSLQVIQRYAGQHPNLIRYETGPNRGGCAARNRGFALSQGEYVLFLDADDLISSDTVEVLCKTLENRDNSIAICNWTRLANINGTYSSSWTVKHTQAQFEGDCLLAYFDCYFSGNYIIPSSILWKRVTIVRVGGWDEALYLNQDVDLVVRALLEGVRIHSVSDGMAYYRASSNSVTRTSLSLRKVQSTLRFVEKLEISLSKRGDWSVYREMLGKLHYANAMRLYTLSEDERACVHFRRAIQLAGIDAISGSRRTQLLTYLLGYRRMEALLLFLSHFRVFDKLLKSKLFISQYRHSLSKNPW